MEKMKITIINKKLKMKFNRFLKIKRIEAGIE